MTLSVAIVGRPNVGKSTFFNRIAGKKLAIIDDRPGITRDWRAAEAFLGKRPIRIIDTAGLEEAFDSSIEARMRRQTEAAMDQADVIVFLIDGRAGVTPLDEHFAAWLRKMDRPVILGVNKCENERAAQHGIAEAYGLGLGDPVAFSSAHGFGMDGFYDVLESYLPDEDKEDVSEEDEDEFSEEKLAALDAVEGDEDYDFSAGEAEFEPDEENPIKLAIAGRPNVGKSTLLNALVEEERVMTGPEAGITRDAIAVEWRYKEMPFRLVDTAGLRRKAKVIDRIEKMSAEDTMRAIRLAQVVVLVLDGNAILEKQDLQIAEHIINEGRALVIAINKWDEVKDRKEALEHLQYKLETSLAQIRDVHTVTISALKSKNIDGLMDEVLKAYALWNARTRTAGINRWLAGMESQHPAPLVQGRPNRLKYITQIKSRPPTFALWVSRPKDLPDSYRRYISNGLRRDFNMPGTPIRLLVRASKNPYN